MNPNTTEATVTATIHEEGETVTTTEELTIQPRGNMTSRVGDLTLNSGDHMGIDSDVEFYGFKII